MSPSTIAVFSIWIVCFNFVRGDSPPTTGLAIVYAINAGGDAHQDIHGIKFLKDPSTQGIASDFGLRLNIDRVHPHDEILYQTERYSPSMFGYDIPIREDGNYVLVLKFSEVYFRNSNSKVFSVLLNGHKVVEDLDIYAQVGYAAAHDEVVPFIVTDNAKKLVIGTSSSAIKRNRIRLDFVKGPADNPKINAFFVARGSVEDIVRLLPRRFEGEEYGTGDNEEDELVYGDEEEEIKFSRSDLGFDASKRIPEYKESQEGSSSKINVQSGPVADDPWEYESPILIYMPLMLAVVSSTASFWFLRVITS